MLSSIYKISPFFIRRLWVGLFKGIRKSLYKLSGVFKTKFSVTQAKQPESYQDFQMKRRYGPLRHFCYAPYTSMFFSLHGKISPCYATYNERSDIYPNIHLHESWFRGSFARIRDEHTHFRFNESCSFCFDLYKNKAYGSLLQQKYEHYAFSKSKYPAIIEFELSNRCNLECIMCDTNLSSSIRKKSNYEDQLPEIYNESFINELREFIPYLKKAEFTGGDPFLIEIYYKIWDLIIEYNPKCDILITTNANTMNARIERLMAKTQKLHFNVSIDALNKEKYEKIRKNGHLETALKNIDIFNLYSKKHKTSINLLVCPMTVNCYEIPELINFGNDKNIGVFFHTVVKPQELSLKYQTVEFLEKLIAYLRNFRFLCKTANEKTNSEKYNNLILLIESWKNEKNQTLDIHSENSPTDIVYNRLLKENDLKSLKKTELLMQYFEEKKQIDTIKNVFNIFEADFLYNTVQKMSITELINFVEQELNKNKIK
jgi:MoaA/NifB/PqqE/SkfB family radical SAM enzyme